MRKQQPVVITGSALVNSALHWDLKYMEENMGDSPFAVYESKGRVFMYSDEEKNIGQYHFQPTTSKHLMPFKTFAAKLRDAMEKRHTNYCLQQVQHNTSTLKAKRTVVGSGGSETKRLNGWIHEE